MKKEKKILQDELTYYYNEKTQLQGLITNKRLELRFFLDTEDHLRKCTMQRLYDMEQNLKKIENRIKHREMELNRLG